MSGYLIYMRKTAKIPEPQNFRVYDARYCVPTGEVYNHVYESTSSLEDLKANLFDTKGERCHYIQLSSRSDVVPFSLGAHVLGKEDMLIMMRDRKLSITEQKRVIEKWEAFKKDPPSVVSYPWMKRDSALGEALTARSRTLFEAGSPGTVYEMVPARPDFGPEQLPGAPKSMLLHYKHAIVEPWEPGVLADPARARTKPENQAGKINVAGKGETPIYVEAPDHTKILRAFRP